MDVNRRASINEITPLHYAAKVAGGYRMYNVHNTHMHTVYIVHSRTVTLLAVCLFLLINIYVWSV